VQSRVDVAFASDPHQLFTMRNDAFGAAEVRAPVGVANATEFGFEVVGCYEPALKFKKANCVRPGLPYAADVGVDGLVQAGEPGVTDSRNIEAQTLEDALQ